MKQIERRLIELESKYKPDEERLLRKKIGEFFEKYGINSVEFLVVLDANKIDSVSPDKFGEIDLKAARKDYLEIKKISDEIEEKKKKLREI